MSSLADLEQRIAVLEARPTAVDSLTPNTIKLLPNGTVSGGQLDLIPAGLVHLNYGSVNISDDDPGAEIVIPHQLGVVPQAVSLAGVLGSGEDEVFVWEYQDPDVENIYATAYGATLLHWIALG